MSDPAMAPTARLTLDDLCVWRGERCLIDGLSLSIAAGELVWLRGENGSGKTSLLRVVAGLAHAERGRILWRGRDAVAEAAAFRADLLYLGHLDALKRALTPRENLRLDAELRGGAAAPAIDAALDALAVGRQADLPVAQLSAGQRRRVALARLALSRAPVWLLDEPTTNLDAAGQGVVAELIAAHLARGGLALVASHLPLAVDAARDCVLGAAPRAAA